MPSTAVTNPSAPPRRIAIAWLLAAISAFAAAPPPDLRHANITSWGLPDGIPEESISAITESPDGYLWLATRQELLRFDGQTFRSFQPGADAGFSDHGLGTVVASGGALWAGGRDYIGHSATDRFGSFTTLNFKAVAFARDEKDRYGVVSAQVRKSGGLLLWRSDGIYTLPSLKSRQHPKLIAVPPRGEKLLAFHEGHSGRRWIVTETGLKVWNRNGWTAIHSAPDSHSSVLEARDGSLWIYSPGSLLHLSGARTKQFNVEPALIAGPLKALMEDRDGSIWVGTTGHALRIRNECVERLSLDSHLRPDDLIQTIHQSRDGAVWMGSRTGVLIRVEAPVFTAIGPRDGVLGTAIAAVQQDGKGRTWIGGRTAGVFVQEGSRWRALPGTQGVILYAMSALRDGRILGADSHGVWVSDSKHIKRIIHNPGLPPGTFRSFSPEYGDHIYVSDFSGVYRLNLDRTNAEKTNTPQASAPIKLSAFSSVRAIAEGPDGIWAVSWDKGLAHIVGGTTKQYPLENGRLRGMTMMELTPRLLLIGTSKGVIAFDRGARRFAPVNSFLSADQIFYIQPDRQGSLWFAGRRGLMSASREAVTAYFEGKRDDIPTTRFTAKQGLVSTNFGLGTSSVATLAQDGSLWLASQAGAIHFRPVATLPAAADPQCAVEEITADGVSVPLTGPIRLGPGVKRLQIQYTVLGRKAPENPAFRFRIDPEGAWVESSAFQAVYTNLKPGSYKFELQARVAALRWPDAVTTLEFQVEPHIWQRGSFQIAGTVCVTLAALLVLRTRGRRMRKQQEVLESRVRVRTEELAHARDQAEQSRARAEAAARVKSEFLANMSHEIRTPLNGVIGMTDLALETELSPLQRELLSIAKVSADSLLTVINDVLDFSKIEAGKMVLDPVHFRLRRALEDTMKIVSIGAQHKGLALSVDIADEVPEFLLGDRGRLRQILLNLLANAVKFTEAGAIRLSVNVSQLRGGETELHFAVTDTGIGIPADKHDSIFLAFEQADGSITRRHGGTGLGLAISARLVQMMGGRIWLESKVGQGTTFHFTVRLQISHNAELTSGVADDGHLLENGTASSDSRRAGPPVRILLAEDNAVNQMVAVRLLKTRGYQVAVAGNGLEAIAAWERCSFDLILLDVQMPEMDGLEAAAEIRRRENGSRRVPIVALTAGAFAEDRAKCLAAGMDDYITKPVIPERLFGTLDRCLANRSMEEPAGIATAAT